MKGCVILFQFYVRHQYPKIFIVKVAHISPSESIQSQNNPIERLTLNAVKSVAASPQLVSVSLAQPQRPEQGPKKFESASEVKTHQVVDGRYLKVISLTDKGTWSAVAARKVNPDYKKLRIRNRPTSSAALDFSKQAEFYESFNHASHWFFIVIQVADCSEFPSKAVEYLAEVLEEENTVNMQWDLVHSEEYLVFFKQTVQSASTPLQMNSASLFDTEDKLNIELSNQGSFQLPLLLNSLGLVIGGHFNGGALHLLNVSLDMKQ